MSLVLTPPISHAVLVPIARPVAGAAQQYDTAPWAVIHANGDLASARTAAAAWATAYPDGGTPVVMTYADHCGAAVAVTWAQS
jgi:hypothetical protein